MTCFDEFPPAGEGYLIYGSQQLGEFGIAAGESPLDMTPGGAFGFEDYSPGGESFLQGRNTPIQHINRCHWEPLEGSPCLGHEGGDIKVKACAATVFIQPGFDSNRQLDNTFDIIVGLCGQSNHKIELEVAKAVPADHVGCLQDIAVGNAFVNDLSQALRTPKDPPGPFPRVRRIITVKWQVYQ